MASACTLIYCARCGGRADKFNRAWKGFDYARVDCLADERPFEVDKGLDAISIEWHRVITEECGEAFAVVKADVSSEVGLVGEGDTQSLGGGAERGLVKRLGVGDDAIEIEEDAAGGVRHRRGYATDTLATMAMALFFDDGLDTLAPLTDLRAAFDVRTGALTTLERWREVISPERIGMTVPPTIADITRERHAGALVNAQEALPSEPFFLINARCVIPPAEVMDLQSGEVIEDGNGEPMVARVDGERALALLSGRDVSLVVRASKEAVRTLTKPWSVRTHRDAALAYDLALLAKRIALVGQLAGVTVIGTHRLSVGRGAKVMPSVVIDVSGGPIVIDENAVVRPGAILIGPCYVGPNSTVLERATIRPWTAIGPWCKVNGEVGGTIFQGYTNKAHDGYLGDSYVGEWVNLGAGTTNSNLLNTYGEIVAVARPGGSYERTGETFLGATIGDHCKMAICTRMMTGCVLHTGSMFATTATVAGCVGRFTWATDAGSRAYRLDKFIEVMRAAMARRNIEPSKAYVTRVAELHGHGAKL